MDHNQKIAATAVKDGNNVLEQVREVTDTAWEKGRETWKDLSAQGKDAMVEAQKNAKKAWQESQRLVQEHPGKAVGIAFIIGAALGALWVWQNSDSH